MNKWENKLINDYIFVSRFIASWYKGGGTYNKPLFKKWLESLGGLKPEDMEIILFQYDNGKMELEYSVEKFIEENS